MTTERERHTEILDRHLKYPREGGLLDAMQEAADYARKEALEKAAYLIGNIGDTVNNSSRISNTCYDCVHGIQHLIHS